MTTSWDVEFAAIDAQCSRCQAPRQDAGGLCSRCREDHRRGVEPDRCTGRMFCTCAGCRLRAESRAGIRGSR
jgi:hypothetical protein